MNVMQNAGTEWKNSFLRLCRQWELIPNRAIRFWLLWSTLNLAIGTKYTLITFNIFQPETLFSDPLIPWNRLFRKLIGNWQVAFERAAFYRCSNIIKIKNSQANLVRYEWIFHHKASHSRVAIVRDFYWSRQLRDVCFMSCLSDMCTTNLNCIQRLSIKEEH